MRRLCDVRPGHSDRLRGRIMVINTCMKHQSNAMQTANHGVLDLYLQVNCTGRIQTHDLKFLTDIKNFNNPSDIKLIQHIKSKIASGEIRIAEASQPKRIDLNSKLRKKTKKLSAKLPI